ncbi:hypothetical protein C8R45DRAFT_946746 [Mycena sanguinolenta]|nr:hypothetical protein C8R45DRAFT_946746 [Mycena sanguinolenta]
MYGDDRDCRLQAVIACDARDQERCGNYEGQLMPEIMGGDVGDACHWEVGQIGAQQHGGGQRRCGIGGEAPAARARNIHATRHRGMQEILAPAIAPYAHAAAGADEDRVVGHVGASSRKRAALQRRLWDIADASLESGAGTSTPSFAKRMPLPDDAVYKSSEPKNPEIPRKRVSTSQSKQHFRRENTDLRQENSRDGERAGGGFKPLR